MKIYWHYFKSILEKHASRPCLRLPDGETYDYLQLSEQSAQIAHWLNAQGLQLGDRLIVSSVKSPTFILLYLACLRSGIIFAPLDPNLSMYHIGRQKQQPLSYYVELLRPQCFIGDNYNIDLLHKQLDQFSIPKVTLDSVTQAARDLPNTYQSPSLTPDTAAAIVFTSGTTGKPKGVVLPQRSLVANALALIDLWAFSEKDVLLHTLPIFHAHGLFVAMNCVLLSGASAILLSTFDVPLMLKYLPKSSVFMGYPAYYTKLLADQRFDQSVCHAMRLFTSGSAPLLRRNFNLFTQRTGLEIVERYGMSETIVITSNPVNGERRIGTIGKPLPDFELRLVDENGHAVTKGQIGRVEVKGESLFSGYWENQQKTQAAFTQDRFFKTGDLARLDEKGYLIHMGREKDLVYIKTQEICARETEFLINAMPGILESAIVGIDKNGQTQLAALVVLEPETEIKVEEIHAHLKANLPDRSIPNEIAISKTLPRNTTGKVDKAIVKEILS